MCCHHNVTVALLLSINIRCCKRVRITVLHKQVSHARLKATWHQVSSSLNRDRDSGWLGPSSWVAGLLQRDFASTLESTSGNTLCSPGARALKEKRARPRNSSESRAPGPGLACRASHPHWHCQAPWPPGDFESDLRVGPEVDGLPQFRDLQAWDSRLKQAAWVDSLRTRTRAVSDAAIVITVDCDSNSLAIYDLRFDFCKDART